VFLLPVALVVALGLGAAAALRREIEDRSVELLLVTPLVPWQIVRGRLLALWLDFLPAQIMGTALALVWMWANGFTTEGRVALLLITWSSFLAAPVVGLRLAVRRLSPVVGWGLNLLISAGVPALFALLTTMAMAPGADEAFFRSFPLRYLAGFVTAQLAIAGFAAWCTVTDLATRRFQLKPLQRAVA
jgi:ABC-type Na+ efflux pump permease subunit